MVILHYFWLKIYTFFDCEKIEIISDFWEMSRKFFEKIARPKTQNFENSRKFVNTDAIQTSIVKVPKTPKRWLVPLKHTSDLYLHFPLIIDNFSFLILLLKLSVFFWLSIFVFDKGGSVTHFYWMDKIFSEVFDKCIPISVINVNLDLKCNILMFWTIWTSGTMSSTHIFKTPK